MQKIAILGAGLIGRSVALLLQPKFAVSLYEKNTINDSNTTGLLAAAMIAPTAESVIASDSIVNMGSCAQQLWPKLLSQLNLDNLYQNKGSLILAHRQDMSDLEHFKQRLSEQSKSQVRALSRFDITRLEPELSHQFAAGLFIESEGQLDNKGYYQATSKMIQNSDIHLHEHTDINIADLPESYDWIIDCRGLGSKSEVLQIKSKLRGVRGEVVRVRAPEVELTRPIRIMHPRHPIYIAPKPNQEFVIGATEIESEDDKQATVRSTLELLSAAYSTHKGFAEAEILSVKAGLRPTFLDNEPKITKSGNFIQINGLYRHGYLLAPYILQQVLLLLDPSLSFCHQQSLDQELIEQLI